MKNILITGASGNLGRAVVNTFLSKGDKIIAIVEPGASSGLSVAGNMETIEADLTEELIVSKVIDGVVEKYHSIDVALLLVGGFAAGGISETNGSSLKTMFSLNFETAYYTARPVFMQMMKQQNGGRIVLVGARPALEPSVGKNFLAYALSKSLLFNLAEFLNAEGASANIVTSVVVPSVIDTPNNRAFNSSADFSKWVKPDEIAEVLHFITSNQGASLRQTVLKMYGKA